MPWPKAMSIVEVDWIDSHSQDRWQHTDDLDVWLSDLSLECRTVGYLYRDADDRVVVLQSQAGVGSVADAMVIPKVSIRRMTVVRDATEPTTEGK